METEPLTAGAVAAPATMPGRVLPRVDRMSLASLALDVGLAAGFVWLAQSATARLDRANSRIDSQIERTQALADQTAAMVAENRGLKQETEQLRRFLASKTEVDVLFLKIMITKPSVDVALARNIAQSVHRASADYNQDPNLVLAMMAVESDFKPQAVSHKGALGLMQVMPQWKKLLGITGDLTDPEISIRSGLQILAFYQAMYPELEMSLTAYNRGPGSVDLALMRGQDPRNEYAPRVLKTYAMLKSLSVGAPS